MHPGIPGAPAPTAPAPTEVVVEGWITGVEAKNNGRFSVKVKRSAEDQYGLSLNTKDAAVVQDLMQRVGQQVRFQCGVSSWWNAQIGQQVESKWINQYAPVGQDVPMGAQPPPAAPVAAQMLPPSAAPAPSTPAPQSRYPFKDECIAFQSMAKGLAVECFKRLPNDQQTLSGAVRIARYWAAEALQVGAQGLIERTPEPQPEVPALGHPAEPSADPDDIPF